MLLNTLLTLQMPASYDDDALVRELVAVASGDSTRIVAHSAEAAE